jgi:arsenite methyltransferase
VHFKIKEKVKERYGQVALTGDSCCGPSVSFESGGGCCSGNNSAVLQPSQSAAQVSKLVGYDTKDLESIPEVSILGAGYGRCFRFRCRY